jgi:hypothetical protein
MFLTLTHYDPIDGAELAALHADVAPSGTRACRCPWSQERLDDATTEQTLRRQQ